MRNLFKEKNIHFIFESTLAIKAALATVEIVSGVLVYFISQAFLLRVVLLLTQDALTEDPNDFIANYLVHSAQNFSISSQHFAALFLLSHGVVKLFLIVGLLREKLWFFPTTIAVFSAFIVYQVYDFSLTHSLWLLLVTVLDVFVIGLTWHEYNYLRAHRKEGR